MLSRLAMEMQLHSGKEKFGSFCIYLSGSGKRGLPLEQDSNLQPSGESLEQLTPHTPVCQRLASTVHKVGAKDSCYPQLGTSFLCLHL
jgi:hypothetical protein